MFNTRFFLFMFPCFLLRLSFRIFATYKFPRIRYAMFRYKFDLLKFIKSKFVA